MYKLTIELIKDFKVIGREIAVSKENNFSADKETFKEIQNLLKENGWEQICNHSFKKGNLSLRMYYKEVESVFEQDFKERIKKSFSCYNAVIQ